MPCGSSTTRITDSPKKRSATSASTSGLGCSTGIRTRRTLFTPSISVIRAELIQFLAIVTTRVTVSMPTPELLLPLSGISRSRKSSIQGDGDRGRPTQDHRSLPHRLVAVAHLPLRASAHQAVLLEVPRCRHLLLGRAIMAPRGPVPLLILLLPVVAPLTQPRVVGKIPALVVGVSRRSTWGRCSLLTKLPSWMPKGVVQEAATSHLKVRTDPGLAVTTTINGDRMTMLLLRGDRECVDMKMTGRAIAAAASSTPVCMPDN